MKIELTELSPVKKSMTIKADADVVEEEFRKVTGTYASRANIPGFRKGKAPAKVIRARFGEEIRNDVRDHLIARLYDAALKEHGMSPLGEPTLDEVEFEEDKPLRFKTTFEIAPRFEVKGYREIEATRPRAEVEDGDVNRTVEELRQAHARYISEDGRAASTGDILVADVEGTPGEGEPFQREKVTIEVGATDNLPTFNQELEGAKAGQELRFTVEYPGEFHGKELAGKSVAYKLDVHEVKRREIPDLDDEFAKDLGDFDDLDALQSRIREDLLRRKESEAESEVRRTIIDRVLLENPIPLPDVLVEAEVRSRMEDLVRSMMRQGLNPETMELDWKEIREKQVEPARKSVHARLVLDEIAKAEAMEIDSKEINDKIRTEAERVGDTVENLRSAIVKGGGMEGLKNQLLREKTLDFVVSVANIQEGD
jgi:trigger factor